MASEAPPFWWQRSGLQAWLLWPASLLYGAVAGSRMRHARPKAFDVPVLCIGNLTVGGSGKTPVAIAIAQAALARGLKPGFLSRGHGGAYRGARLVDVGRDTASLVGDEPMLLAAVAPTAVARKRPAGLKLLMEIGCDFIVMDDGFQSRRVHFDHALVVVDANRGVGNGHVLPAGPLRAALGVQIMRAGSFLIVGEGEGADGVVRRAARAGKPIAHAQIAPRAPEIVAHRSVIGYCGIGDPERFGRTLRDAGAHVVELHAYPDHHRFSQGDARDLLRAAARAGATLVTTAKDAVRLAGQHGALAELAQASLVLEIGMRFAEAGGAEAIIERTLDSYRARKFALSRGSRAA